MSLNGREKVVGLVAKNDKRISKIKNNFVESMLKEFAHTFCHGTLVYKSS